MRHIQHSAVVLPADAALWRTPAGSHFGGGGAWRIAPWCCSHRLMRRWSHPAGGHSTWSRTRCRAMAMVSRFRSTSCWRLACVGLRRATALRASGSHQGRGRPASGPCVLDGWRLEVHRRGRGCAADEAGASADGASGQQQAGDGEAGQSAEARDGRATAHHATVDSRSRPCWCNREAVISCLPWFGA